MSAEKGTPSSDYTARGERRTLLAWPTIKDDCTESDWSFFMASWERYECTCKLDKVEVISHLWSACSDSMQKYLLNKGATNETSKVKMLDRIKKLAVRKRNNPADVTREG